MEVRILPSVLIAGVAQWLQRRVANAKITGSTPVIRSDYGPRSYPTRGSGEGNQRAWYIGCASAFQAGEESSSLSARSFVE